MEIFERTWNRAWRDLGGAGDAGDVRDRLLACYAEPHRFYHTLQHLRECINHFESCINLAEHPGEVEYALWFHDAVCDPHRHDNEAMSAVWAETAAVERGVPMASACRVRSLVLVTRHDVAPAGPDEKLIADVDLSILAAPCERFDEYERQVRREYAFMPDTLFKVKRGEVLRGFLGRTHIFNTNHFRGAYESAARDNLKRSLFT
jgi:predicted metal-dependent HD superfamily phosphohydrolase